MILNYILYCSKSMLIQNTIFLNYVNIYYVLYYHTMLIQKIMGEGFVISFVYLL